MLIMPMGKGTYGSRKGRPPAKKAGGTKSKGLAELARKRPRVAAAIMRNKKGQK